ncbi:MAG: hypothetical protein OXP11_06305 [Gammaproteobacteria bacterium]|nr:hypothetical protein [Gammaproteobacteria bacterium]
MAKEYPAFNARPEVEIAPFAYRKSPLGNVSPFPLAVGAGAHPDVHRRTKPNVENCSANGQLTIPAKPA